MKLSINQDAPLGSGLMRPLWANPRSRGKIMYNYGHHAGKIGGACFAVLACLNIQFALGQSDNLCHICVFNRGTIWGNLWRGFGKSHSHTRSTTLLILDALVSYVWEKHNGSGCVKEPQERWPQSWEMPREFREIYAWGGYVENVQMENFALFRLFSIFQWTLTPQFSCTCMILYFK